MRDVAGLITEVAEARHRVVAAVQSLTTEQGAFKCAPDRWSVQEIVEHLVLAEQAGIHRIWLAADGLRRGQPVWQGEAVHRSLPIEEVIVRAWKPKEKAPPNASPQMGGPLAFSVACLHACHPVLEGLGDALHGLDLSLVIFPHFLSGPLDARQRLEFLRFHLDRHRHQIEALMTGAGFPRQARP
ncbi:MAG: DinB family protein [Candidatus Methylomirabilales bacterium]